MAALLSSDYRIEEFTKAHRAGAIALIDRVFPSQGPLERLGLRLFRTRYQWLLDLIGVHDGQFWLAVRDGQPIGTVGLYSRPQDRVEARWLAWFCVGPEARGKGLGDALLDLAITHTARSGRQFLRLYTSTDPNEAAAQRIYERRGFGIVRVERPLLWRPSGVRRIIREYRIA